ncbi:MAG TPA: CHAT domain-containing protein [Edaphobacter sp.]
MALLRLTQTNTGVDSYRVEVALERTGSSRQTATSEFKFSLTAQEREDMRWYFEDYLQYPIEPAPKIAGRIENRLEEIGKELFRSIFQSGDDARDLWATIRSEIDRYRVEVVTGVQEAASIPWELIRDPKTDTSLALRAEAFVRSHPTPAQQPRIAETGVGPIRVLLVICRPGGRDDVPFRSVASRLVKGLKLDAQESCDLKVLRPPTFDQLSRELLRAKLDGKPYHIVHFDGHGVFADTDEKSLLDMFAGMSKLMLAGGRGGKHGFLLFESVGAAAKGELVDGSRLGKLLAETHVPLLVLNACRSAHADPPAQPMEAAAGAQTNGGAHEQVRAFGSLAQEVMDAGVAGVVAMRYNVYVITAAQFVADLYSSLVQGDSVGIAATAARKQLAAQPMREIGFAPCSLQDWGVPVVYESAPMMLFPKAAGHGLTISLNPGQFEAVAQGADKSLPPRPDIGFFGRDETLLALDRAFDTQAIVLLHSYAGSGKTSTAVEFARWYDLTGGINGPILFTSFEQYQPLSRVLDQLGERLTPVLEQVGVHWLTLNDRERREIALRILQQIPVLWIWDNVEPIAGFPTGTQSAWSAAEQQELVDFLRAASQGKAKFLLTSRRDERAWLGELPRRIGMPAMPTQERVQLARALAERHGRKLDEVEDWRPLLEFSRGNPFTITVLVGEALRSGLKTRQQIEDFVVQLREGTANIEDDETEGRDRSLGASLSYGFSHAFSEEEQRLFALLHLFQGMVSPGALVLLCDDAGDASPAPEVHPTKRPAVIAMLDRAAEVGLLTAVIPGSQYTIHPAVPWYFKRLFESYYSDRTAVNRRFVDTMAGIGGYLVTTYNQGERGVLFDLNANEQNMLHALRLAREHGWWGAVINLLRAFKTFYTESGRTVEFARVLEEAASDFVDPKSDNALPSMEEWWFDITLLRASEARSRKGGVEKAEQMYTRLIAFARHWSKGAVAKPSTELNKGDRTALSGLATALQNYGVDQWLDANPKCVESLEESLKIAELLGDEDDREATIMHLAHAYMDLPSIRDLEKAEHFYRRVLDQATRRKDPRSMAHALHEVGQTLYWRFTEELQTEHPRVEKMNLLLNEALGYALKAAEVVPPNNPFASHVHHLLGNIYDDAGQPDVAIPHYMRSIQIADASGDLGGAAKGRREMARAYMKTGRLENALAYAIAALENLETKTGTTVASGDIEASRSLVREIQWRIEAGRRGNTAQT